TVPRTATSTRESSAACTRSASASRSARRSYGTEASQNVLYGTTRPTRGRSVEMPDLLVPVELAVLVGQRHDHVLEPLRPARVDVGRADLRERGSRVGVALDVGDDREAAAEQRVVREAGFLDGVDELRPDLVVTPLVLGLRARTDLEGEARTFHSSSFRNRYRYRMLPPGTTDGGRGWRRRLGPGSSTSPHSGGARGSGAGRTRRSRRTGRSARPSRNVAGTTPQRSGATSSTRRRSASRSTGSGSRISTASWPRTASPRR